MKLKIEVDLQDLMTDLFNDANYDPEYGHEVDFNLKEEVVNSIVKDSKEGVLKKIKEPILKEIQERVKILVQDSYGKEIEKAVEKFVKNGKVKERYSSEELSVEQWIENNFQTRFENGNNLDGIVEKKVKALSAEIRSRYDMLFASQIVIKLNEQGLLKENVINTILDNGKNKKS